MTSKQIETAVERLIYGSRWILAPIYLGLSLALLALGLKFFQEIFHVLPRIFAIKETDLVLLVLTLIDLALVGGLIIMVMLSSYETFVSRLDLAAEQDKLGWLGRMDYTSLKNKVASSIVAISSIHLLKVFMNTPNVVEDHLFWYVVIHLTFVASAFAMGMLDRLTRHD
ncbi:hypothetical protein PC39_15996 [Salinisphaera sp. PC39]